MTTKPTDTGQKTFATAMEKAIAHSSMEVLNGETQLYSLVSDFLGNSPQSKLSLNLLLIAIECGIPARLYGAASKDKAEQTIMIATCRKLLIDNYSTGEVEARQFMQEFATALGWEVAAPPPEPPKKHPPAKACTITGAPPTPPAPRSVPAPTQTPVKTEPPATAKSEATEPMERIGALEVTVPSQWKDDVICLIDARKSWISDVKTQEGGKTIISAIVPEMEMYCFEDLLSKLTSGQGRCTYTHIYDHDWPMPAAIARRLKEKENSNATATVNPLAAENANAINLVNGGRVAYYDGYYYYSDLFEKSLFGLGRLYRCKIGQPPAQERIFKQKGPVTHINIVDGFLYAIHTVKSAEAEIIKINLSNPKECTTLYSGISRCNPIASFPYSGSSLWSMLQYYDGWLYFSKDFRTFCRIRPDGSDFKELKKPASRCFVGNHTILYHCFEEYTLREETAKNTMHRMSLDGTKESLLFESDLSLAFKVLYGANTPRMYYTRYVNSNKRYQIYSRTTSGGDKKEIGEANSRHEFFNIYNDYIFYIAIQELRKMKIDGTDGQFICKLEHSADVLGIQVYAEWIFLDMNYNGVLAISHDGKQQFLLK